jgi:adenosylhomocysteine nucleosidase
MSAPDRPVLVVTAMAEELAAVLRRLGTVDAERVGRGTVFRTRWAHPSLVVASTGDGAPRAEARARELADAFRPTALLGVGLAGALSPELARLDLVASERVRNGGEEIPAVDPLLLTIARSAGARPATLVTVSSPLVSPDQKKTLAESAAAAGGVAAVDMESAGWARGAAAAGVPFVVVRAISDTASDSLPDYLADCVGANGGIRRSAVIARALARPGSIRTLWRLRRRTTACAERLAGFVYDFFFR